MAKGIQNGFADLAKELEEIGKKITDDKTSEKVMQAGADVILNRARNIAAQNRRTGTLEKSINSAYSPMSNETDIGWGGDLNASNSAHGFYGMFLDNGFVHARSGKLVELPHLKSIFESEKENVFKAMVNEYKKELGG